jgi:hypothetical protein
MQSVSLKLVDIVLINAQESQQIAPAISRPLSLKKRRGFSISAFKPWPLSDIMQLFAAFSRPASSVIVSGKSPLAMSTISFYYCNQIDSLSGLVASSNILQAHFGSHAGAWPFYNNGEGREYQPCNSNAIFLLSKPTQVVYTKRQT